MHRYKDLNFNKHYLPRHLSSFLRNLIALQLIRMKSYVLLAKKNDGTAHYGHNCKGDFILVRVEFSWPKSICVTFTFSHFILVCLRSHGIVVEINVPRDHHENIWFFCYNKAKLFCSFHSIKQKIIWSALFKTIVKLMGQKFCRIRTIHSFTQS